MTNGDPLVELRLDMSRCRVEQCLIPTRHPFYPVPQDPPFNFGVRPCLPVVPTYLTPGKVMIIGHYPNCRFGTISAISYVPVADINEPFESGRYYNGHDTGYYRSGDSLRDNYLTRLGLDLSQHVWLTNMIKCFMMKDYHITRYDNLGWTGPGKPQPEHSYDDRFDIAAVCMNRYLTQELPICEPKLIIALGGSVHHIIHGGAAVFSDNLGVPLRANAVDTRIGLFQAWNVIHLFHPTSFLFDTTTQEHWDAHAAHIQATQDFMDELGLP